MKITNRTGMLKPYTCAISGLLVFWGVGSAITQAQNTSPASVSVEIGTTAQGQTFPAPTPTGNIGNKDTGALAEIREYRHAVSSTEWRDLLGTGMLTFPTGDTHAASLYLMGSKYSRLDIEMGSRMRSFRITGCMGESQDEKGNYNILLPSTSATGIVAFPRIWDDSAASSLLSLYDHSETWNNLHRITIEYLVDPDSGGSAIKKKTAATDLYFDPRTHLLIYSVDSVTFKGLTKPILRVTSYTEYQPLGGVLIPARIRQELNGQEQWTLQLSQVILNMNPPASTFSF